MANDNLEADDARLREFCLGLPEAEERETWETPTYRVRSKVFAISHLRNGTLDVWCKGKPGAQDVLTGSDPDHFFVPPYVGGKGWLGIRIDAGTDWDEMTELLRESYRMVAPKRLAKLLEEP